jgi:1,4-dihydroxy-2-naphthoyl-CoA synthase
MGFINMSFPLADLEAETMAIGRERTSKNPVALRQMP